MSNNNKKPAHPGSSEQHKNGQASQGSSLNDFYGKRQDTSKDAGVKKQANHADVKHEQKSTQHNAQRSQPSTQHNAAKQTAPVRNGGHDKSNKKNS